MNDERRRPAHLQVHQRGLATRNVPYRVRTTTWALSLCAKRRPHPGQQLTVASATAQCSATTISCTPARTAFASAMLNPIVAGDSTSRSTVATSTTVASLRASLVLSGSIRTWTMKRMGEPPTR